MNKTEPLALLTVSPNIERLQPYVPGKSAEEVQKEFGLDNLIKLASNENPFGPSPRAVEAVTSMAKRLHLYPDASANLLRDALAKKLNVSSNCLVFGNGSDDIIHLLGITFLQPDDEVLVGVPSFVRYFAAADLNNASLVEVPLTPSWEYNLDAMAEKLTERTRLVFLANPNNPTGVMLQSSHLENFVQKLPENALLVLDEAYYEFAADTPGYPNAIQWVQQNRNVAVLRTFSKAYGLAGLRIGYGVMPKRIAHWLERTREPFNVNSLAQAAAAAALNDTEYLSHTVQTTAAERSMMTNEVLAMGLSCTPSAANFLWIDTKRDGNMVANALMRQGVIVRYSNGFHGPTHIRVSIGTPQENQRFLQALRTVIA